MIYLVLWTRPWKKIGEKWKTYDLMGFRITKLWQIWEVINRSISSSINLNFLMSRYVYLLGHLYYSHLYYLMVAVIIPWSATCWNMSITQSFFKDVSVVDEMEIFINKRLSVTNKLKKIGYQIFTFKETASHKT